MWVDAPPAYKLPEIGDNVLLMRSEGGVDVLGSGGLD